jgi:hypothetical protein
MTLYNVLSIVPQNQIVTIANYIDGSIYADRKQTFEVIEKIGFKRYFDIKLLEHEVYKMEIGKTYGDLIVSVLKD